MLHSYAEKERRHISTCTRQALAAQREKTKPEPSIGRLAFWIVHCHRTRLGRRLKGGYPISPAAVRVTPRAGEQAQISKR
jgi:DNA invertase Pin-like site-specific DNA recombinase